MISSCRKEAVSLTGYWLGLYPVIYSKERYDTTEYEIETLIFISSRYYGFKIPFCTPDSLFRIKSNTFKGLDWAYEKEWRLIYSCGYSSPRIEPETLRPKAIYIGTQISASNERIVRKLIEGKELPLYKMYEDNTNKRYALCSK